MSHYRKIIWNEGMFLIPHHFQQWDHYQEENLNFRLRSLNHFNRGVIGLKIDKDALANDRFALLNCSGVMPDGLSINIPETDGLPEGRNIKDYFLPSMEALDVYLAIPIERRSSLNFQIDDSASPGNVRYLREFVRVADETTGQNEKDIGLARKNLKILFSGESLNDFNYLKIAELVRTASGIVTLREEFIPTCLGISASEHLMNLLRQLLEILAAKSSSLSGERRQKVSGSVEFGTSDISNFWFLHTVNSFIPLLSHFYNISGGHPEQLYLVLAQLAGELATFAMDIHPKDLPGYNHDDLSQSFGMLYKHIRDMLETVIPSNCIPIPLERAEESLFVGRVTDDRLLDSAQFYIGVKAEMPERELMDKVPQQIKTGSLDNINIIVNMAMPGVTITHSPRPPAAIRIRMGYQYFRLEKHGDYWDTVQKSKTIAIYVPSEFAGINLELMAIKE